MGRGRYSATSRASGIVPFLCNFNWNDISSHKSLDELLFICRAFLTFRACSLILRACFASGVFESIWFSFNESPLDGCLVGDVFLADPSTVE